LDSFFQNIRALQKSKPKRRKKKKQNTQVQIIKIESGSVTFILRVSDRYELLKLKSWKKKQTKLNKKEKKNFKQEEEEED
jgi:hypothetical protein